MNMLSSEQSLRLKLLRFPLIVGVVFIHARLLATDFSNVNDGFNFKLSDFVQHLVSEGIARTAVPLLFLMSGYLFLYGAEWSMENYWKKIKSRTRSLLVPFLFWNVATLLVIGVAQAWSATQGYFSGKNMAIADFTGVEYVAAVWGIGRNPISYQFWFIRDLMLLVLLTPLIYQLNKRLPLLFLLFLFSVWFFGWVDFPAPAPAGVLFYSTGCFLGYTRRSLFTFDRYGIPVLVTYAVLVIASVVWSDSPVYPFLHKVHILFGMVSCLYLTKIMAGLKISRQALASLGAASFFVFSTHEPLLSAVNRVAYKMVRPEGSGVMLTLYFTIPAVIIMVLVIAYRFSSRIFPQFTSVITGGR